MTDRKKGRLFVLSGPSGAGKGTVRTKAFEALSGVRFSVSCTTRPPREGERDGVDYRFLSDEDFRSLLDRGCFLEHADVHGYCYGTLREDVERILAKGEDIILEIDVQGALQVRAALPECVLIFVMPPSLGELERRLRGRGTEGEERIALRMKNARWEMAHSDDYDYVIENDDAERASRELADIILSFRTNTIREDRT